MKKQIMFSASLNLKFKEQNSKLSEFGSCGQFENQNLKSYPPEREKGISFLFISLCVMILNFALSYGSWG